MTPIRPGWTWNCSRREIVNAILYRCRTGRQWRYLPHEYPPHSTVHEWFVRWRKDRTWDRIHYVLTNAARAQSGHDPSPGAAIIDSQSVPNAVPAEQVGYDGRKQI